MKKLLLVFSLSSIIFQAYSQCMPMATPFTENFESTANGSSSNPSPPTCWSYVETPGAAGYGHLYFTASYARSGSKTWRMTTSSTIADGDSMAFVTPQIANMTTVPKMISFWSRSWSSSSSYNVSFVVGTVASPSQLNTFVPLDTFVVGNSTVYQNFEVFFTAANGYNGTHEYIAFLNTADASDIYVFDDITISDAPVCIPSTGVSFSGISNNAAIATWSPGQGINQQIEYGLAGFTQGTGVLYRGLSGSFNFTNLSGSNCYDVYVRDSCANGLSPWVGPFTFCTLCDYYQTPITEGFENTATGTNQNPSQPTCWSFARTGTGSGFGFTHNLASSARTGSKFFYSVAKNNKANNDLMGLVSPGVIGLTNGNNRLELWARCYHGYAVDTVQFIVGTVNSPLEMNTFAPIDTFYIGNSQTYSQFITDITVANGYNGMHSYIAILDYSSAGVSGGTTAFIDDITIAQIPSCTASSNIIASGITYNSATISWTAGQGSSYNIEYGPTGFTQGTGPVTHGVTNTNYSLSGLAANTCYDVYVQDSCANGLSPWSGPITFCTSCTPVATPYLEDFENATTGSSSNPSPPNCWSYWAAPSTMGYGYTSTSGVPNGTKQFRMYSLTTNTNDTIALISPAITGITNSNIKVMFKGKTAGTSNSGTLIVGTTPSPNSMRNATMIDTIQLDITSFNTQHSVSLNSISGYNGTDEYVFFMHGNATTYTLVYVDDISFEVIPPCVIPSALNASNITSSGAGLSWASANGTAFRLEYGPAGFTQGTGGNGTVISNATSPTAISGLIPNTNYQFYVADNCDSLNFAGPFSFTTNCTGALSGNYTVGTSTSDFATVNAAVSSLKTCGVSGPVNFLLQGGVHNNTTIMLNAISGASSTNTISFIGGSVAADTLRDIYSLGAAIDLDGASYITFKNLSLQYSNATRFLWMHNACDYITFDSVNFIGLSSTSSAKNLIVASSSATSVLSAANNVSHFTLKNCVLNGGYHAVMILGQGSSNKNSGFVLENNTFSNNYFYGIRMYNVDEVLVKGNKLNPTSSTSYGIVLSNVDDYDVIGNEASGGNYALYMEQAEVSGIAASRSSIVNNMFVSGKYGMYFSTVKNTDIYHNSIFGEQKGVYMTGNFNKTFEFVNNIVSTNLGEVIYTTDVPTLALYDYNVYHTNSTGTAFAFGTNTYANLAAWQTGVTTDNDSSLFGDPMFIAPNDLRISLGTLPNNKGDNSVNVLVDIDGNVRPATGATRVDIGAYEYTPALSDFGMTSATLHSSLCLSQNDTVQIVVTNVSGSTADLTTDSIVVNWTVSGPINSSGALVANTGSLMVGASRTLMATNVNMSMPGLYTLNAHIAPSAYNTYLTNDTADAYTRNIYKNWNVTPMSDSILTITDSVDLSARAAFFGRDNFFITEMCQNASSSSGLPAGGKPTWLLADDYIEITGAPGADLSGITFEQWSNTILLSTVTFAPGTMLSPAGTAVIAAGSLGGSGPSPSNYYYHGTGSSLVSFSSGDDVGRILKTADGKIIDAVAYGSAFSFPAAAGVSSAEWSGTALSGATSWGLRLEGDDLNSPAGWIKSTQNPNGLNASVSVPAAASTAGFAWSQLVGGSLVPVSVNTTITVGASTPGIFYYVASYNSACGSLADTVAVYSFVGGCTMPTAVSSTAACTEITLTWTSDPGNTASYIEYGLKGFTLGAGTAIVGASSPQIVGNLLANTTYDFFLIDSCSAGGFSTPILKSDSTELVLATAAFTWTQSSTGASNATIDFNAAASANATSYVWDFGDGSAAGSGIAPTHSYLANGMYYVTLRAINSCDTAVFSDSILVAGISVEETLLRQSLNVFPNPNIGNFTISFALEGSKNVSINILNTLGQVVYQQTLENVTGENRQEINLHNQAAGIYYIQIKTENEVIIKQISVRN